MRACALFIALTFCQLSSFASVPTIESVSTGLGQRGTSFEVEITGSGLDEQCEFLFYKDGITCESLTVVDENTIKAKLAAAADCFLGRHPFHLRNTHGMSELRVLRIISTDLSNEVEPNNSIDQVQPLQLGSSVVGILASEDSDFFKVTMKAGQRLGAEVEAIRLASRIIDLKLSLYDPKGALVKSVDDTPLGKQDPYLTHLCEYTGEYSLLIEASGIDGTDGSRYVLHVGDFPRPDYVFPPGGPVNQATSIAFLGDETGNWEESVKFEETGTLELYPGVEGSSAPTAVPFRVSPFDNIIEVEGNDDGSTMSATPSELPIAFNGILSKPGDVDHFKFAANENETIEIAVFAAQLGSPVDTVLRVLSADGKELTVNDDSVGLDSKTVWTCPESGEYMVQISEKRRAGGDRYVYRVEARIVEPTIVAFLPRKSNTRNKQSLSIPRGNRVLEFVGVRRHRWNGEAEIAFPQLPSGVTASFGRVAADEYAIPVVFEASSDAEFGAELVEVAARAYQHSPTIEGKFDQAIDLVAATADRLYQGIRLDRMAVSVVQPVPFSIRITNPPCSIPRDGSLGLTVEVLREPGFDGSVEVQLPFLPEWVDGPDKVTIDADQQTGKIDLYARPEVELRDWPFVAVAKAIKAESSSEGGRRPRGAQGGMRRPSRGGDDDSHEVCSQLLSLPITESPITSSPTRWLAAPGETVEVSFPLRINGVVPETLEATLEGLPARVTAVNRTTSGDAEQVSFEVMLDEDAPFGQFDSLVCKLSGTLSDHQVTYYVGRGSSIKIVKADELLIDESGRPLSPLEILRRLPIDDLDI